MAEKSEELKTVEDKIAQAKELFARGSRNYLVKAYNDAADDLSQVCNIYEEVYGQLSDELGVPYLLYAKSLIALAEDENKVLSVPDEQNDDDDDDDDDVDEGEGEGANEDNGGDNEAEAKQEETEDNIEANKKPEDTDGAPKQDESNVEKKTNGDAKVESSSNGKVKEKTSSVAESSGVNDAANVPEPGTSNGVPVSGENNEENEEEDDGANLQVAWEILELAVKIFERQGEPARSKLAEAYSELAGISFENSHCEAAIADFKKSLEIHMKLPDDNRRIVAEIHYKIGLAHLMQNSFDDCIRELKRASELIDEEIEEAKQKENQTDKEKDMIKDLEETKQDILAKIVEVEETKTQSIEEVRNELSKIMSTDPKVNNDGVGSSSSGAGGSGATVSSSTEKAKPTDISHLIKRKKPDNAVENEVQGSPAKRPAV